MQMVAVFSNLLLVSVIVKKTVHRQSANRFFGELFFTITISINDLAMW